MDLAGGSADHRYLWARWEDAGTILASRLVDTPAVVLDRLTTPGEATPVATLPYTMSTDASPGDCPIDGYLAGFAARPDGVVLAKHSARGFALSCPHPRGVPADCGAPLGGLSFEIRPTSALSRPGPDSGDYISSRETTLVADAERSNAFAYRTGGTISVIRRDAGVGCCQGGQSGSAFSLSPNGDKIAFSPDGTDLRVADLGRTGEVGRSAVAGTRSDHRHRLHHVLDRSGARRNDLAGVARRYAAPEPGRPQPPGCHIT